MEVETWHQDNQDYLMLTITIDSVEGRTRRFLSELQDIEKLYPDISDSDFKLFDINTEPYWENKSKFALLVPVNSPNLFMTIKRLNQFEERQLNWKM